MNDLDERKRKILQAVVWSYVETAEPVGSGNLARRYSQWGVKSATIRNALADLADRGYLRQPHASAGRIPSDQGYRFYVDHLMVADGESAEAAAAARARREIEAERAETLALDRILRQTCLLLTQMTRYTSVATPPRPGETSVRQLLAAPSGTGQLLIVALLSTGGSEHRVLTGDLAQTALQEPGALVQALNAVNARYGGVDLEALPRTAAPGEPLDPAAAPDGLPAGAPRALYLALAASVLQIARGFSDAVERTVVEGANEILRHPEFKDVAKLEGVLDTLHERAALMSYLTSALPSGEATVVIGEENPVPSMRECSVVTATYYIGSSERGTLGVIGPTRMDYDRALPAVSLMARSLSETLTRLA